MCTNLLQITNQSHQLAEGEQFKIFVPCGKCDECQIQYVNNWKIRSYYEALECISKGGFVYFDTLTFRNSSLTHFNNIPCFNLRCIQLFNKAVRQQMQRTYGKRVEYRYLITSEYGKKNTKRPHYHVIFYIHNKNVNPLYFSRLISEKWKYGRTDGTPYQPEHYVRQHNIVNQLDGINRISCYVTKYVMKDFNDKSKIDKAIEQYILNRYGTKSYPVKLKERKLRNFFGQTLKVSKGFGSYLLKIKNPLDLLNNSFKIVHQTRVITLPRYYVRKYTQYWQRDENNNYKWFYNEIGLQFKFKMYNSQDKTNTNTLVSNNIEPTTQLLGYMRIRYRIPRADGNNDTFTPINLTPYKTVKYTCYNTPRDKYENGEYLMISNETGEIIKTKQFKNFIINDNYEKTLLPIYNKDEVASVEQKKLEIYKLHKYKQLQY